MESVNVTIRPARVDDAAIIAEVVAMGIRDEAILRNYCGLHYIEVLTAIASSSYTLYSWQHALIAEVEGKTVGAAVGYDGALLHSLREQTFAIIYGLTGHTPSTPDETEAGEFYLDSLAVMPAYRNLGIGTTLLSAMCKKALAEGHRYIGLLVDIDNPRAEMLYATLGFEHVGERLFFGHQMHHLQAHTTIWAEPNGQKSNSPTR